MRKSDGLTYQKRHSKRYRAPKVNAKQTAEQRREKYKLCRAYGMTPKAARQFRDFDNSMLKTMGIFAC